MGILDDAIREHLDLKRRQGAADDELQRLEDEAFGPPSRPGDPDFPQSEEQPLERSAEETAVAEAPYMEAPAAEPPPLEQPELEQPPEPEAEAAVEPETAEPRPETGGEEGAFFDRSGDDLDLDLDEGIEDVGELAVEEPEETGAAEDAPIETLPTVEHHFEEAIDEAEVVEDDPDAGRAMDADTEGEDAGEDEDDVLEETPEFLRDAPEDDELWFEQGEPKDFDF
jgi:hypothetical protein